MNISSRLNVLTGSLPAHMLRYYTAHVLPAIHLSVSTKRGLERNKWNHLLLQSHSRVPRINITCFYLKKKQLKISGHSSTLTL